MSRGTHEKKFILILNLRIYMHNVGRGFDVVLCSYDLCQYVHLVSQVRHMAILKTDR